VTLHFDLPNELIARRPLVERSASRMLVVDRAAGTIADDHFIKFPSYLRPGDCHVFNNTRVIPARLFGQRPGHSGKVEIFLLRPLEGNRWQALVRPGKKLAIGHMPLPPYIDRPDEAEDRERYQTIYAKHLGAAAAPTAGLHFTPEILAQVTAEMAEITLHVGLGTFQPLTDEHLSSGKLHREFYAINATAAAKLAAAKRRVAIGTTSARTIETTMLEGSGDTDIFIRPGYAFKAVGAMLTNFHLPGSSLMMLVAALAGEELIMRAYACAIERRYRFYSYGDCMLIL